MIFSNKKCNDTMNIFMKDCLINRVQVTKFLGVMIDEALNWKSHILYIKTKLSKNIAILYKTKNYFEPNVLRMLYCSLILPYLLYCIEIWGNTYKTNLQSLVITQKKADRLLRGVSRLEHTNNIFNNFKLLNF